MPISGIMKHGCKEPYYIYSLIAEITHNGKYEEVVLVDEKEVLDNVRPFLPIVNL